MRRELGRRRLSAGRKGPIAHPLLIVDEGLALHFLELAHLLARLLARFSCFLHLLDLVLLLPLLSERRSLLLHLGRLHRLLLRGKLRLQRLLDLQTPVGSDASGTARDRPLLENPPQTKEIWVDNLLSAALPRNCWHRHSGSRNARKLARVAQCNGSENGHSTTARSAAMWTSRRGDTHLRDRERCIGQRVLEVIGQPGHNAVLEI